MVHPPRVKLFCITQRAYPINNDSSSSSNGRGPGGRPPAGRLAHALERAHGRPHAGHDGHALARRPCDDALRGPQRLIHAAGQLAERAIESLDLRRPPRSRRALASALSVVRLASSGLTLVSSSCRDLLDAPRDAKSGDDGADLHDRHHRDGQRR